MPQLDIVTFFSQFFWLCIFYIGFYYLLYKYFLPQYSRSILFRDKLTYSSSIQKNANLEEKKDIEESLSLFRNSLLSFSKNFFSVSKNDTERWQKTNVKKTNEANWKTANLLYIESFGTKIAKKNLAGNCISITYSDNIYLFGLSKMCKNYRLFFSQPAKEIPSALPSVLTLKSQKKEGSEKGNPEKIKQKASVKSLSKHSQKKARPESNKKKS